MSSLPYQTKGVSKAMNQADSGHKSTPQSFSTNKDIRSSTPIWSTLGIASGHLMRSGQHRHQHRWTGHNHTWHHFHYWMGEQTIHDKHLKYIVEGLEWNHSCQILPSNVPTPVKQRIAYKWKYVIGCYLSPRGKYVQARMWFRVVVIRHLPKRMICGGDINAIKWNEPPKTKTHTWPIALLAYGMVLPELPSFKELTREVERSCLRRKPRRLY